MSGGVAIGGVAQVAGAPRVPMPAVVPALAQVSTPVVTPRPRVLLLAEACNPAWVSIPLEGWSLYKALRAVADVHLVTQVRNRADIEATGLVEGRDFTAIDSEAVAGPAYRAASLLRGGKGVGWTTQMAISAISYPYFEKLVWRRFEPMLREGRFDLVHRLTPVSPTLPSPMARWCRDLGCEGRGGGAGVGVPFVMGPLNGGIPWPKGWGRARLKEREFLSFVRGAYRLLPGYRQTLSAAGGIIAGSRYTGSQLPSTVSGKCHYVAENGIDPARFAVQRRRRFGAAPRAAGESEGARRSTGGGEALRVVFVGRLVPYKGPDVLIEAAAPLVHAGLVEVTMVGDGPMMGELKSLVRRLRLDGGVHLLGKVPHEKLCHLLAEQDVLGFPSVREFGGAVVVEAMAMGVVPVVVDYGGPGELVTLDTGVLVPLDGREGLKQAFRRELAELAMEPERVNALSQRARERAFAHFTWDAKAAQVAEVYRKVRLAHAERLEGMQVAL